VGGDDGFVVDVVPALTLEDGRPISSSLIREAVAAGDVELAWTALGRPYSVAGRVVRGAGRGRTIGIPTVNLEPPPARKLLPSDGVYACTVRWDGETRGAMANLGPRPTFGEQARGLEAHLFGFDGDLYGRELTVEFVSRLRDVVKFDSVDALRAQLATDRAAAVEALRKKGRPVSL
jgi:riboflavin kinase/FMN adenylyltransferase